MVKKSLALSNVVSKQSSDSIEMIGAHIVEQVGVRAGACVNTDQATVGLGVIAGAFQRFPRTLEKETVLRVHDFRFSGSKAKELSVKQLDVLEYEASLDIVGSSKECGIDTRRDQLAVGEKCNRLDAVSQIVPKLLNISGARKTTGHADNRYAFDEILLFHVTPGTFVFP